MTLIDNIYDALLDDAAFEALPAHLAQAVGARSATFITMAGETPVHVAGHYFSGEMSDFYLANGIGELDVWNRIVIERGLLNRVVSADDFMSREAFRDGAFYNEFFRRFGDDTGVSLGAIIQTQDGHVGLGLHRALTDAEYDDEARAALGAAIPHLRRLAETRARLTLTAERLGDIETLLHGQAAPILLTGAGGRILFANEAAVGLLARADGLASRQGTLRASGADGARLEAALAAAAGAAGRSEAVLVGRPSGRAPLRLVVAPHRGLNARPGRAMVMIDDPSTQDPGLVERLRGLFGLSPAEARLAVMLFEGRTLAEIAEERGVLASTARSQLNAVLMKTGAGRQSTLMALIGRLPRPAL